MSACCTVTPPTMEAPLLEAAQTPEPTSSIDSLTSNERPSTSNECPPTCDDAPPTCDDAPPTCDDAPPTCDDAPPTCDDPPPTCDDAPPTCDDPPPTLNQSPPPSKFKTLWRSFRALLGLPPKPPKHRTRSPSHNPKKLMHTSSSSSCFSTPTSSTWSASGCSSYELIESARSTSSLLLTELEARPSLSLSDFTIVRTIGMGSFGVVCLATLRHTPHYLPVALKIVKKEMLRKKQQFVTVREEKHILETSTHPFIVKLFKCFQDDLHVIFVLEFVHGGELFSRLRSVKHLSNISASFYAAEVALVLQYLHSKRIVYRDLKPENILINPLGHIRLVDFGLAKKLQRGELATTVCGTNEYLAPETLLRRGYNYSVDWWGLGVLLYEMLVGAPPFTDKTPFGLFCKILGKPVVFPEYLSGQAKELISHLLNKNPMCRLGVVNNDEDAVLRHKFFKKIKISSIVDGSIKTPYVPTLTSITDSSCFQQYPEFVANQVDKKLEELKCCTDTYHFDEF